MTADDEALALLARRAGGSMRDSQSLLEQLLAFGGDHLSVDSVHQLLGTAHSGRITGLVQCCSRHDAAGALAEIAAAIQEGVEISQLVEQLLGYFRDMMAAAVNCPADAMLHTSRDEYDALARSATAMGLARILAAIQILDQAIVRMRASTQIRPLAETAVVRLCHLEQLDDLATVVAQLQSGAPARTVPPSMPAAAPQKKTTEGAVGPRIDRAHEELRASGSFNRDPTGSARGMDVLGSSAPPVGSRLNAGGTATAVKLSPQNSQAIWEQSLAQIAGMTAVHARRATAVAISGPNRLAISFPASYTSSRSYCQRPAQRQEIEAALAAVVGETVRVEFREASEASAPPTESSATQIPQAQLKKQVATHPLVKAAIELFDGTVVAVERPATNGRSASGLSAGEVEGENGSAELLPRSDFS
jgi:DNA polymerase-3 subunit gamma/tau